MHAERIHRLVVDRYRGEMLAHCLLTELALEPCARRVRVRQRFERGERLGRDDEQGLFRVRVLEHVRQPAAVDIGNELAARTLTGKTLERQHRHRGPQIRAADADVHDPREFFLRAADHRATSHAIDEAEHAFALVEHEFLDLRATDAGAARLA